MSDTQSTQPQLFDVAELPGQPMLRYGCNTRSGLQ